MQKDIQKIPDEIIVDWQLPKGWELSELNHNNVKQENDENDFLKKTASQYLSFITHRIELFIDQVYKNFEITIPESHIYFDEDGTFHIIFLVFKEAYFSPIIYAIKLYSKDFFSDNDGLSVRTEFMLDIEFSREHTVKHVFGLMYENKPAKNTDNSHLSFGNNFEFPPQTGSAENNNSFSKRVVI